MSKYVSAIYYIHAAVGVTVFYMQYRYVLVFRVDIDVGGSGKADLLFNLLEV